jgi:hypothetical protein
MYKAMEKQDDDRWQEQLVRGHEVDFRRRQIVDRAEATLQRDRQRDRSILNFVDGNVLANAGKIYDMDCQELDKWIWKEVLRRQRYYNYKLYPLVIDALWDWLEIDLGEIREQNAEDRKEAQKEAREQKLAKGGFLPPWIAAGNLAEADPTPIAIPATIYALLAPDAPEPFALGDVRYVGQSKNAEMRYVSHVASAGERTLKGRWVESLRAKGLRPKMRFLAILDMGTPQSVVDFEERMWIAYLRYTVRAKLVNLAAGGIGGKWGGSVVRSPV